MSCDGSLYKEELFSTEGISDLHSLLYHCNPPTQIVQVGEPYSVAPKIIEDKQLKHRSLKGWNVAPEDDYLKSRKPLLVNADCKISVAAPKQSMTDYFFKNADADDPDAIPAPYNHSNIDSDEVLYYVDGDFMSRSHVEKGMFTLHPGGIPPLYMTEHAYAIEDQDYYKSWL